LATLRAAKKLGFQICCGGIIGMGETDEQLVEFAFTLQEIAPDSIPVNVLHPIEGTPLANKGILDPERVIDSVALLRLVNPSTPLRFAGGRRDMTDDTAAKCIYVGMSAGIAGPLLTTPGADFDDDRALAVRAGFSVGRGGKSPWRYFSLAVLAFIVALAVLLGVLNNLRVADERKVKWSGAPADRADQNAAGEAAQ
jgi:biotin synthase-like enzyme